MKNALQLTRYNGQDGIEILINQNTGESYCSVKGYARMSGKDKSTISRRLVGVTKVDEGVVCCTPETAEILTASGVQRVALITEDQIVEWLPKDNPIAASALLKMGVRMALHAMAGYSVSTAATSVTTSSSSSIEGKVQLALNLAGEPGSNAVRALELILGASISSDNPANFSVIEATAPQIPLKHRRLSEAAIEQAEYENDLFNNFLVNLRIALKENLLDGSIVAHVQHKGQCYLAIRLLSVLGVLETRFNCQPIPSDLQRQIVKHGGKQRQVQRFEPESKSKRNGSRSMQSRCLLIPIELI